MKKIKTLVLLLLTIMVVGCGKANTVEPIQVPEVITLEQETEEEVKEEVQEEETVVAPEVTPEVKSEVSKSEVKAPAVKTNTVKNKVVTHKYEYTKPAVTKKAPTEVTLKSRYVPATRPVVQSTKEVVEVVEEEHEYINLSINEEGSNILSCKVEIKEGGETLSSVMHRVADSIDMQLTDNGGYISKMNGRSAYGMTGWIYEKNGVIPNVGISGQVLSDGDSIVWNYGNHSDLILR